MRARRKKRKSKGTNAGSPMCSAHRSAYAHPRVRSGHAPRSEAEIWRVGSALAELCPYCGIRARQDTSRLPIELRVNVARWTIELDPPSRRQRTRRRPRQQARRVREDGGHLPDVGFVLAVDRLDEAAGRAVSARCVVREQSVASVLTHYRDSSFAENSVTFACASEAAATIGTRASGAASRRAAMLRRAYSSGGRGRGRRTVRCA